MSDGCAERSRKANGDVLTAADAASHRIIVPELRARFPSLPIVSEEGPCVAHIPRECIVVDELDGTIPFSQGLPHWGVTLAYIRAHRPVAGVIRLPDLGIFISAWSGGLTIDGASSALSRARDLADAVALVEVNRQLDEAGWAWVIRIAQSTLCTRALACTIASAVELLTGGAGIYLNCRGGHIWDFAAATLILEQAGACACGPDGHTLRWDKPSMAVVFASNPILLDHALRLRKESATFSAQPWE